jgi:phasin
LKYVPTRLARAGAWRLNMNAEQTDVGADTPMHAPHIDIPEGVKQTAVSSLEQIKDVYERLRANTEAMSEVVEKSSSKAVEDTAGLHTKMIEAFRVNLTASLDLAGELAASKSLPEMIGVWTRFARRQFDTFTAQCKDFWSLGQQMMSDTAKPIAGLSRGIDRAASS